MEQASISVDGRGSERAEIDSARVRSSPRSCRLRSAHGRLGDAPDALDVATLDVEGRLTGQQARAAMQGHILDQASLTGTYTLNPSLLP